MKFQFQVIVSLKPGLLDPQGRAIEGSLPAMGWANASNVRVGKYVELVVDAETEAAAVSQVDEMARRLLSNPVIEGYRIVASAPSPGLTFEDVP
jgi:phosphoribosylformylglycinamidine synthase PurS subunit